MTNRSARIIAALLAGAVALPAALSAQERKPEIEQLDQQLPGTIINDPTSLDWPSQGTNFKSKGIQSPDIPGGGAAAQYTVQVAAKNRWEVAANVPLTAGIKSGEDVTVGFWARATSAGTTDGKGALSVRIQMNAAPWPGFGDQTLSLGSEWKWYEVSGTANVDIPRGSGIAVFQLGEAKQVIEIGQTIVVKGSKFILTKSAPAAAGLELPPQLTGKGSLLNRADNRSGWTFNGAEATRAFVEDKNVYMRKATRFTSAAAAPNRWDIAANVPIEDGINEGDQLLIGITARTVSAATTDGKGVVGLRIQNNTPPDYDGFVDASFKPGPNWQLIQLKVTAPMAIPAGKAQLALHFAGEQQVVEVGPVYVLKVNPVPPPQP